jgi:hypothetical protein
MKFYMSKIYWNNRNFSYIKPKSLFARLFGSYGPNSYLRTYSLSCIFNKLGSSCRRSEEIIFKKYMYIYI